MSAPPPLRLSVHGVSTAIVFEPSLAPLVDPDRLRAEVAAELAVFAAAADPGPPGLTVDVRAGTPGESHPAPDAGGGWLGARVTPEVYLRWRPAPPGAEVIVHRPPVFDELVLVIWARVATAMRFVPGPGGEPRPRAAFHAASWAGPAGGLLVLGESGAGKTTLSRHLTHGPAPRLGYLGDEDALVEWRDGAPWLLAMPRRLRLLYPGPTPPPGREFKGFGEAGWLADLPGAGPVAAPLAAVVELAPVPGGDPEPAGLGDGAAPAPGTPGTEVPAGPTLIPLPRDRLAYALLRAFERFPPGEAPGQTALFRAANRAGFEAASRLAATRPGFRLRYRSPGGFAAAAAALARLASGCLAGGPAPTIAPL